MTQPRKNPYADMWQSSIGILCEDERETGGWTQCGLYGAAHTGLVVAAAVVTYHGMHLYHATHTPKKETPDAVQQFEQNVQSASLVSAAVMGTVALAWLGNRLMNRYAAPEHDDFMGHDKPTP